jgi:hypothetical protein
VFEKDRTGSLHTFSIDYLISHLRDWEQNL